MWHSTIEANASSEYHWEYFEGALRLLWQEYRPCSSSSHVTSKYPQRYSNSLSSAVSYETYIAGQEEYGCLVNYADSDNKKQPCSGIHATSKDTVQVLLQSHGVASAKRHLRQGMRNLCWFRDVIIALYDIKKFSVLISSEISLTGVWIFKILHSKTKLTSWPISK